MKKPLLVIMAAGMGSRYGGLKQIDPVDEQGHIIMDFSLYDAARAGFDEVVLIIKRENEADFRAAIGDRISEKMKVHFVYQELTRLPDGVRVPEGRVKPWGTGHAILCCKDAIGDAPFAVINADDYYGREAFRLIYEYLTTHEDDRVARYAMVGYALKNTVTEHGSVARGVCVTDEAQFLTEITERTRIEVRDEGIAYTEDDGSSWHELSPETTVSMNLWGFSSGILQELERRFPAFLEQALRENPLKAEYFLPSVVSALLQEEKATVQVLRTPDQWFGVTYQEDKQEVVASIRKRKEAGLYPENF